VHLAGLAGALVAGGGRTAPHLAPSQGLGLAQAPAVQRVCEMS
jgi:hypothetical protein